VKLWQTRRGIIARFHYTPPLLVAVVTLLGSLQYVAGDGYAWWVVVVSVHLFGSIMWAAQMYRRGEVGLYWPCRRPARNVDRVTRHVIIFNLVMNMTLGITGLAARQLFSDFTMYVLTFLTLNGGFYTVFYFVMKKLRHKESPSWFSVAFLLIGMVVTIPALVVFSLYNPYNTNESAALSREANVRCIQSGFFDAHDIWHFLSAIALFCIFMGILTLDDDLMTTPRHKIPVF